MSLSCLTATVSTLPFAHPCPQVCWTGWAALPQPPQPPGSTWAALLQPPQPPGSTSQLKTCGGREHPREGADSRPDIAVLPGWDHRTDRQAPSCTHPGSFPTNQPWQHLLQLPLHSAARAYTVLKATKISLFWSQPTHVQELSAVLHVLVPARRQEEPGHTSSLGAPSAQTQTAK